MLEVNKIIIELLQIHDCVIFPNLGGFVAQYSPAKLNSINNTFTPPFKQILFNKNLTNNDGLLVNAIAQRHSISFQESNKKLSILLDKINNELDNSSKYLFEGIGMLFRNQGVLNFKQQSENLLLDSFGLKTINIREFSISKPTKKIINLTQSPISKTKIKNWTAAAAAIVILFYSAWIPMKTDLFNNSKSFSYSDLNPFTYKKIDTPKNLNFNKNSPDEKVASISTQEKTVKNINTIVEVNVNKDEVPPLKSISKNVVKPISFEVIIGSFSDESNAKKLIKNLSEKSFKARQLAFVKKLFRVSAGKFSNKENAIEYQNTIKKKFKISSWILIN